jgi:hypothetical protein
VLRVRRSHVRLRFAIRPRGASAALPGRTRGNVRGSQTPMVEPHQPGLEGVRESHRKQPGPHGDEPSESPDTQPKPSGSGASQKPRAEEVARGRIPARTPPRRQQPPRQEKGFDPSTSTLANLLRGSGARPERNRFNNLREQTPTLAHTESRQVVGEVVDGDGRVCGQFGPTAGCWPWFPPSGRLELWSADTRP